MSEIVFKHQPIVRIAQVVLKRTLVGAALAFACISSPEAALPYSVTVRNFFGSLTFPRAIQMAPYPGEDSAYVVVQQAGKLMTVRWKDGAWAKTDSATITVLNGNFSISEQGLLGVTFHPNFRQNRKYYLYYVAPGAGNGFDQIVERVADSTLRPKTGDAQRTILKLQDPYDNHNSGTILFGKDGFLYFGLGDGGNLKDPQGRAQNLDSLFGKFMRLDVSGADDFPADTTKNYAIPTGNPFVGQGTKRPEIWAYGLRNPYRWSFHPVTGEIWVGDVGQDYIEEISRVSKGANMGWKVREGNSCFNTGSVTSPLSTCDFAGMTPSIIDVFQPAAQSIIGGVFFIGNAASAFNGAYFFGDYQTDSLWAARFVGDSVVERIRIGQLNAVSSFALDNQGRVFATSVDNNTVNILESPDMVPGATGLRASHRAEFAPIHARDILMRPSEYAVRTLDGRSLSAPAGRFQGMVLVRKKGSSGPAQLLPLTR